MRKPFYISNNNHNQRANLQLKFKDMKSTKVLLKINYNGELMESKDSGITWKITYRAWSFNDISKGYKRESKKKWKRNNETTKKKHYENSQGNIFNSTR